MIETYIYEESKKSSQIPFFLGKGSFEAMPRVGEYIYPIRDTQQGKVKRIINWNNNNTLSYQGMTCIYVELNEVDNKELMEQKER